MTCITRALTTPSKILYITSAADNTIDPHYTGSDNIKSIHGKGVFWKEASFWKKDTFYNLCLPLSFNGI